MRIPRFRAPLLAAALLAPLVPSVSHAAAPAQTAMRVVELVRLRRGGPARFTVIARMQTADDNGGLLAIMAMKGAGHARSASFVVGEELSHSGSLRTYGTGQPDPACPNADVCGDFGRSSIYFTTTLTPAANTRYVVTGDGTGMQVTVDTPYWTVRLSNVTARRVLSPQSTATGVQGPMGTVEHFQSATAHGGRYGSFAYASVPCDGYGAGSATLSAAGFAGATLGCQPVTDNAAIASTNVAADWTLRGDVVGVDGGFLRRLFVLDYPKP
jgi:hypothetical protein